MQADRRRQLQFQIAEEVDKARHLSEGLRNFCLPIQTDVQFSAAARNERAIRDAFQLTKSGETKITKGK